jgi:hypothetical protein
VLLWPTSGSRRTLSATELAEISPYLHSGFRSQTEQTSQFVGMVSSAWARLETPERAAAATDIGSAFENRGVGRVVLFDRFQRLQVHFEDGALVEAAPAPAAIDRSSS